MELRKSYWGRVFTTKVIIYIHIEPYHEKENIKFDMSAKFEDLWINMVRTQAFENLPNYYEIHVYVQ